MYRFGTLTSPVGIRLRDDVRADAVVDAAGDDPAVRELLHVRVEHAGVSHAHPLERLGPAGDADIDPQVQDLGRLVQVLALHQVHGLLADDTAHGSLRTGQQHALPDQHLGVPSADPGEVQISFVVHVSDLDADLVDVAGEHEPRLALRIHHADRVAVNVRTHLVREALHLLAPNARRRGLEPGWTR